MLLIFGCSKEQNAKNMRLNIFVSILPQKYFVEKITKDKANISVMVLPGASPATYEPRPNQMKSLSNADLYVRIGVPFENVWMEKISNANEKMKIIKSYEGIKRIISDKQSFTQLKDNGKCIDPHIWLSPNLVKIQVENIYNAIVEIDSKNKEFYTKNNKQFLTEINELDKNIRDILKNVKKRKFIVFHPSWSYFANDYGLEQIPIEIEGKEPSAIEMKKLIELAKKESIKVIFVQPQFNKKSAETIAKQIDGKVVEIDPLAENWIENLLKVANTFSKELK
ncbi:MAG: cation ABC transporter substrate-binding protein [Candidatus Cloacimonadota bacterium]|nr:MAG: cation ABC transporter substrate-binding protein [Candidatus Cloacimonadota bacterium]